MDAKTLGMQHAFADDLAYNGRSGLKPVGGLTKRELFAAMAMQGALAAHTDMSGMRGYEGWREEFSRESIRFADALLAELAKEQP